MLKFIFFFSLLAPCCPGADDDVMAVIVHRFAGGPGVSDFFVCTPDGTTIGTQLDIKQHVPSIHLGPDSWKKMRSSIVDLRISEWESMDSDPRVQDGLRLEIVIVRKGLTRKCVWQNGINPNAIMFNAVLTSLKGIEMGE